MLLVMYNIDMRYSRRELNKIKSRRGILRASRKLFSAQGYDETMIEEIALKAEVSKATVYNYFPNKESLLIGIVEEVLERVEELLDSDLLECTDSLQRLRRVMEEFVLASADYPSLSRRIAWLNSDKNSALFGTRQETNKILKKLVLASQNEGLLDDGADADEMVDTLMGIYLVALFQWKDFGENNVQVLKEKLNRLFDTIMNAYLPDPKDS